MHDRYVLFLKQMVLHSVSTYCSNCMFSANWFSNVDIYSEKTNKPLFCMHMLGMFSVMSVLVCH